jgi:hypothetical protein
MILRGKLRGKPEIYLPEMETPESHEYEWKGIEEELGQVEVHIVPADSNGSWRPIAR